MTRPADDQPSAPSKTVAVSADPGGGRQTIIFKTPHEAAEWVEFLFAEDDPGEVTVKLAALTPTEVDALPEFQGY